MSFDNSYNTQTYIQLGKTVNMRRDHDDRETVQRDSHSGYGFDSDGGYDILGERL